MFCIRATEMECQLSGAVLNIFVWMCIHTVYMYVCICMLYFHTCICILSLHRLISRYHPKHISAREEAMKASLQSRVQAFVHLLESGRLDNVPLWTDCVDDIVNSMDAGNYMVYKMYANLYFSIIYYYA